MGGVTLRVLGPLDAIGETGLPVPLAGRRRVLLAHLAARRDEVLGVDQIVEGVWGAPPGDPTGAVQTLVSRLRKDLGDPGAVETLRGGYRLGPLTETLDSAEFEAQLRSAREVRGSDPDAALDLLEAALALWQGAAFGDLADLPAIEPEAVRLEELHAAAREERAELLLDCGRFSDVVAELEPFVAIHPLREHAHALLMEALYRSGRAADALGVARRLRERLGEELGAEPGPEIAGLETAILRHELPEHESAGTRAATNDPEGSVTSSVPLPLTPLVGRDRELAALTHELRSARLVTIAGPPGVGKSRLALHVASEVEEHYSDGVQHVELGALVETDNVLEALASALGIQQREGVSPTDRLVDYLSPMRTLLLLDGVDRTIAPLARLLSRVLPRAGGVDVLVTSREPLEVDGELVRPLPPLSLSGDGVAGGGAEQLFVNRARAARPDFSPEDEALNVAEICRRLDGLPLALELAAARLRTMTAGEVASGLDERFRILGHSRADENGPRSLRAAIDWSYEHLDDRQRTAFDRLSVLAGPFTIERAVALASDVDLAESDVPSLVSDLVDKSLLIRTVRDATSCFTMLDSFREYGRERLEARGELEAGQDRHASFFAAFAARTEDEVAGPGETAWLQELDDTLADLRSAADRLRELRDAGDYWHFVGSLYWYAYPRMQSEVFGWARELADTNAVTATPDDVARVAGMAALGSWMLGDRDGAVSVATRGVERSHEPGHARFALEALGDVALFRGDCTTAEQQYSTACELARATGDDLDELLNLANVALARDYDGRHRDAREPADTALRKAEALGSPSGLAITHYVSGEIRADTDPTSAVEHLERAVRIADEVGNYFFRGTAGLSLVTVRARTGDAASAVGEYPELLEHWRRMGAWGQQWTTIRTLVEVLTGLGEDESASVLIGALEATQTAAPAFGADAERLDRARDTLRKRLGGAGFSEAVERGRELGDEAAVAFAREVAASIAT